MYVKKIIAVVLSVALLANMAGTWTIRADESAQTADSTMSPAVDPDGSQSAESASIDNHNTASAEASVTSVTDTGNNQTASGSAAITTGDASANAKINTQLNTTVVGTDSSAAAVTLYDSHTGPIDLSAPVPCRQDQPPAASGSGSVAIENKADVSNTVDITASTGSNETAGDTSSVTTGTATAEADIVTIANTSLVGNCDHLTSVTLFHSQTGDIILPTLAPAKPGASDTADNQHVSHEIRLATDVFATATTGGNDAQIITAGNATIMVRQVDVANTTISGDNIMMVRVNNPDLWHGVFTGFDGTVVQGPGYVLAWSQLTPSGETASPTQITIKNEADISSRLAVKADTGHNTADGASEVKTGDATAKVNVFNLINTSLIGNNIMYTVITLFDDFWGNIVFHHDPPASPAVALTVGPTESSVTATITLTPTPTEYPIPVPVAQTVYVRPRPYRYSSAPQVEGIHTGSAETVTSIVLGSHMGNLVSLYQREAIVIMVIVSLTAVCLYVDAQSRASV